MSSNQPTARRPALAFWIIFCTFCNCVGWILSAFHALNRLGYSIAFVLGIGVLVVWVKSQPQLQLSLPPVTKIQKRFRRIWPLSFLVLAALMFLGGAFHAPSNYDALAYRVPRVLHWLAEGRWHWIHTEFQRLNTRTPGFEWTMAPLIALTGSDRLLFLLNALPFLLLPGLVFSVFTRLGVRQKVAWHWMWLAPTGYSFLLQAGSIGNDMFGAVFVLAAIDFALRARQSKRISDVWLACLAAALVTSSKASNLPLLLPCVVALGWNFKLVRGKPALSAALALAGLCASMLPMAVMNLKYCGDWTGLAAEKPVGFTGTPVLRIANNAVLIPLQNLAPPVFPLANKWNEMMIRRMPSGLRKELELLFEPFGAHWSVTEMESEEQAGLGLGVSGLALLSLLAARFYRRRGTLVRAAQRDNVIDGGMSGSEGKTPRVSNRIPTGASMAILGGAGVALLVFMAKSGLSPVARLITPYYLILLPGLLLAREQERVIRTKWWRGWGLAVFAMAGFLVVVSPARPLWPVNTVLSAFGENPSPFLARARTVYFVYSQRPEAFAPALKLVPPDVRVLGLITFDDPEASLWKPFFHLRIEHVTPADSLDTLRARNLEYILVNSEKLRTQFQRPLEQWLTEIQGTVRAKLSLPLKASWAPSEWLLVQLDSSKKE